MNKALESLEEIIFDCLTEDDEYYYKKKLNTIKKALQQPILEELKQSIIDRLNELVKHMGGAKYNFIKTTYKYSFFAKTHMPEIMFYFGNKKDEFIVTKYLSLPLDLAHDITTYFIRLRDSEWKN